MAVPNWLIGVVLAFTGSCVSNLGVNLQKLTHNRLKKKHEQTGTKPGSVYKEKLWLVGLLSVIAGSIADLVSFGFGDMSLLAPLGAMTLVVNLFFAPCFLKEGLTKRDILCTLIIIAGTVTSVAFGSKSETNYTLGQLVNLYTEPLFITYACLFACALAFVYLWFRGLKQRKKACMDTHLDSRIEKFIFPFLAGAFGAHSVLFAKSSAEVFKMTFKGDNQFIFPGSYFFIFFLVFFLLFQMHFLNMGLERSDALYVVPVYQVCWVIMGCLVGFVYFKDYEAMTELALGMFILGVIITVTGVYILSQRYSPENIDKPIIGPLNASTTRVSIGAAQAGGVATHHVNVMGENIDAEITLAEQAENEFFARERAERTRSLIQTPRTSLLSNNQTRYSRLSDADDQLSLSARLSLLDNEGISPAIDPSRTPQQALLGPQDSIDESSQFETEEETAYGYIAPMAIFTGISSMFGSQPVRPRTLSRLSISEDRPCFDGVVVSKTSNDTPVTQPPLVPVPSLTTSPQILASPSSHRADKSKEGSKPAAHISNASGGSIHEPVNIVGVTTSLPSTLYPVSTQGITTSSSTSSSSSLSPSSSSSSSSSNTRVDAAIQDDIRYTMSAEAGKPQLSEQPGEQQVQKPIEQESEQLQLVGMKKSSSGEDIFAVRQPDELDELPVPTESQKGTIFDDSEEVKQGEEGEANDTKGSKKKGKKQGKRR